MAAQADRRLLAVDMPHPEVRVVPAAGHIASVGRERAPGKPTGAVTDDSDLLAGRSVPQESGAIAAYRGNVTRGPRRNR
jgi:hypothetical protein